MLGPSGAQVYPDVHGAQKLLKYDVLNTGCCSVLSHPRWGTGVYPATMFARAPEEVLHEVLDGMKAREGAEHTADDDDRGDGAQ